MPESSGTGFPLHDPTTPSRPAPEMGQAQKVEGLWTIGGPWDSAVIGALETHLARLLTVKAQAVPTKTLGEDFEYPFGISLIGEHHHRIIGVPYEESTAPQSWENVPFEPHIQNFMQVDVGQQRGDHSTLRRSVHRAITPTFAKHTCFQPLVDLRRITPSRTRRSRISRSCP